MEPNIFIESLNKNNPEPFIKRFKSLFVVVFLIFIFLFIFLFFIKAPKSFPINTILNVEEGSSVRSVSLELKNKNLIQSRTAFEVSVLFFGKNNRVVSGDYYFEANLPVYELARRISLGEHNLAPISVTIPEGFDNKQIADTFSSKLHAFNKQNFLKMAESLQGELFPDTYFFLNTFLTKTSLRFICPSADFHSRISIEEIHVCEKPLQL
jgi:cell division protein YceG involved in septum cleavage